MREQLRAVRLLVGTAWRTDPWRSAGLLLEPLGQIQGPLLAVCLAVVTDAALAGDTRRIAWGVAGIAAIRAGGGSSKPTR